MTKEQFIYGLTACGCLWHNDKTWYEHNELIECFENLGLLEQEPKTGHWKLYRDYKNLVDYPQCNICGAVIALPLPMDNLNYCPNCGCKMESEG